MIDKSSPIPVYFQLKNDLVKKIAQGLWKPGAIFLTKSFFNWK